MVNDWKQIAYKKLDADGDTITLGDTTAKTAEAKFGVSGTKTLEDFSDDGWTDSTASRNNVSGGVMNWDFLRDGGHDASAIDLGVGFVSEDAWTLRFKLTIDALSAPTNGTNHGWFGLFNEDQDSDSDNAQNMIAFQIVYTSTTPTWRIVDGTGTPDTQAEDALSSDTPSAGLTRWFELKRISTTRYSLSIFSDSTYTTLVDKLSGLTTSAVNGLRYLKVLTTNNTAEGGTLDGTIDDVEFWNGTNTVVEGGFEPHDMMKLEINYETDGNSINPFLTINGDKGGSYSFRRSLNGATDTTGVEQSELTILLPASVDSKFVNLDILDFPNQEKLFISHSVDNNGLGSGTAPDRSEVVSKHENQTDRIISLELFSSLVAKFKKGSSMTLYGAQRPTITHANGNTLAELQGESI